MDGTPVYRCVSKNRLLTNLGFFNFDVLPHGTRTNEFGLLFLCLGDYVFGKGTAAIVDHKS